MHTLEPAFVFETVMDQFYVEIFHYIRKMTQNTEDAKDLTQDVFLKIYEKQNTYDPLKSSLRTWIYRIAHHHVINHFRSAAYVQEVHFEVPLIDTISPEEDILSRLLQEDDVSLILHIMQKYLNSKQERILHLYFFSELSVANIATVLGMPEKTVSNTITLAIHSIKRHLEGRK